MTANRERMARLEQDLAAETAVRRDAEAVGQQRAWQSKWSIVIALIGMPISIGGAVVAAWVIAALK